MQYGFGYYIFRTQGDDWGKINRFHQFTYLQIVKTLKICGLVEIFGFVQCVFGYFIFRTQGDDWKKLNRFHQVMYLQIVKNLKICGFF